MIIEWLCDPIFYLISSFIYVLPQLEAVQSIGSMTYLVEVFRGISNFMPMTAFGVGVVVFVGIQLLKLASSLFNWVIRKVPTIS